MRIGEQIREMVDIQKTKQIDYRFKIMYALGVIFVASGHCEMGGISLMYDWFPPAAFHLGLFVFASGYFYKSQSENNIIQYIFRKAKALLLPMYLWNFFYAGVVSLSKFVGFTIGGEISINTLFIMPITNGHQFLYNMGGWFVVPLFMLECLNVLLRKCLKFIKNKDQKEILFFVVYCMLGTIGTFIAFKGFNTGLWLVVVRMLYFLPFYGLGVFYRTILERFDNCSSFIYFSCVFICELVIICIYKKAPAYTPSWCNDFVDGPILPFIVGFLAVAFWLRVSKILDPVVGRSKVINLIADNSYSIMIHQFIGFMLIKSFFGVIHLFTSYFTDFDMQRYKTDIWYYYLPWRLSQTKIIYLVAGICLPIAVQLIINKIGSTLFLQIKLDNEGGLK